MSLQTVLSALIIWDGAEKAGWKYPAAAAPYDQYSPREFSDPDKIISYIKYLYENSPDTMAPLLDDLASRGPIRIARNQVSPVSGLYNGSFFVPERRNTDGTLHSDSYVSIEENPELYAFNNTGQIFKIDPIIILAHELGHWGLGTEDTENDTNSVPSDALLNRFDYDYEGGSLRFENIVAAELGKTASEQRQSYGGAINKSTMQRLNLVEGRSYTRGELVDIVRFGFGGVNDIDISQRTDAQAMLAFGFEGDDVMIGGIGNDHLFGGANIDRLTGGDGNDRLYGGEGNDWLNGAGGSTIYVGGDNPELNVLNGGTGTDTAWFGDSAFELDLAVRVGPVVADDRGYNPDAPDEDRYVQASVSGRYVGTNLLVGIEKLKLTDGVDKVTIHFDSTSLFSQPLTIEMGGGVDTAVYTKRPAPFGGENGVFWYNGSTHAAGEGFGFLQDALGSLSTSAMIGLLDAESAWPSDNVLVKGVENVTLTSDNDRFVFSGQDYGIHSGYGTISAGDGGDIVVFAGAKAGGSADLRLTIDGGSGNDWLYAAGGTEATIVGGLGRDWIYNTSANGIITWRVPIGSGSARSAIRTMLAGSALILRSSINWIWR